MKSMNKWILTGIVTIVTAGFCAQAQDTAATGKKGRRGDHQGGPYAGIMAKFDTNKDGTISAEEKAAMPEKAQKHYTMMMEKFDANKDGKLDEAELAAMKAAHDAKGEKGGKGEKGAKHGKKGEAKAIEVPAAQ